MKNKMITLNGKEYIEIEKYNKLKNTKIILKDYAILDPTNCWGIFPYINREEDLKDILETDSGTFKKIEEPKITMSLDKELSGEKYTIENTKFSKDFISSIIKMGDVMYSDYEFYMKYSVEKEKFLDDEPILIIFGNKLCFMLAPIIEN
jgi:hypothetical protein